MHVENKQQCTGCGACYNTCPVDAINMQGDEWGFYKPIINKEKCVNCGLCEKICPLDNYKSDNIEEPRVFAFQNNDEETLYKCASGGAFAGLAKYIIEQGGIVYGVIYDENIVVCHSRIDNLNDLEKMYSSKYVQSNTRNTFKQAKEDLEKGKFVLFSGTPCQIAGLKSYLQKDYENIVTVDLVCHGVPSPLVFEKYKREFMAQFSKDEQLLNINFRSKVKGWSTKLFTTTTTTNTTATKPAAKDNFMRAFLSNLSINASCLDCQFNKLPRVTDITLGDFWGVDEYDESINNNKGLSIVLINSEKGECWFNYIKNQGLYKEIPLNVVLKRNHNINGSSQPHKNRNEFLNTVLIENKSLKFSVNKYLKQPLYIMIYRLLPKFVKNFIKYKILKIEEQ